MRLVTICLDTWQCNMCDCHLRWKRAHGIHVFVWLKETILFEKRIRAVRFLWCNDCGSHIISQYTDKTWPEHCAAKRENVCSDTVASSLIWSCQLLCSLTATHLWFARSMGTDIFHKTQSMWKGFHLSCSWQVVCNMKCPVVFLSSRRISQPVLLESLVGADQGEARVKRAIKVVKVHTLPSHPCIALT